MSKLDIYEFGRQLLDTRDIDPTYVVLWEARLEPILLRRFLLAYFCYYHFGTASWVSNVSGEDGYWSRMMQAAGSKDYPRSPERRHFRGQQAIEAVTWLQEKGVEELWRGFPPRSQRLPAGGTINYVKTWKRFGPWSAFKVCDMLERLDLCQLVFNCEHIYESPLQGARLLRQMEKGDTLPDDQVVEWAAQRVLSVLGDHLAPPRYERKLTVQEVETILCKHASYLGGHYHVGEDIAATKKSLLRFARCPLAQRLYAAGRRSKLWA